MWTNSLWKTWFDEFFQICTLVIAHDDSWWMGAHCLLLLDVEHLSSTKDSRLRTAFASSRRFLATLMRTGSPTRNVRARPSIARKQGSSLPAQDDSSNPIKNDVNMSQKKFTQRTDVNYANCVDVGPKFTILHSKNMVKRSPVVPISWGQSIDCTKD